MRSLLFTSLLLMAMSVTFQETLAKEKKSRNRSAAQTVVVPPTPSYAIGCPFDMPEVARPVIPGYEVCITDFGGVADGTTLNTDAFARGMKHLAEHGGGRLNVPAGIWLTGPIQFESNVDLHVKSGALVLFTSDYDAYPEVTTIYEGNTSTRKMAPLYALDKENIAITGLGSFDGQGQDWRPAKRMKFTESQWKELIRKGGAVEKNIWYPTRSLAPVTDSLAPLDMERALHRPVLLEFTRCRRVLLQDATFSNSPAWNVHPLMCEDITIDRVNIRNPWFAQNGDGLDLESCKRALVINSTFDVGDDAICIKSGKDKEGRLWKKPCEYVIISGCTVLHGHGGFTIGSEMSSGAHHIWVNNCVFNGTDTGLRLKSTRGRGGIVEDIYIDHIQMNDIAGDAFTFDLYYANKPVGGKADADTSASDAVPAVTEETPCFRNLYISHVTCRGAKRAIYFNGLPEMPISNLQLSYSQFVSRKGAQLSFARDILFDHVSILPEIGDPITFSDIDNITVR